jgi:hypothetical protein
MLESLGGLEEREGGRVKPKSNQTSRPKIDRAVA